MRVADDQSPVASRAGSNCAGTLSSLVRRRKCLFPFQNLPATIGVDANRDDGGDGYDATCLTFRPIASIRRQGQSLTTGRSRKVFTLPLISSNRRLTWLSQMPDRPKALTRSSTERSE